MSFMGSPAALADADRAEVSSLAAGHLVTDGERTLFQEGHSEIAEMPSLLAKQARQTKLLTSTEEFELANRAKAGDCAARQKLIESHRPLVLRIASAAAAESGWIVPLEDLINDGMLGLVRAVRTFNPTRINVDGQTTRLASYAWKWIEGKVRLAVRRAGDLPSGKVANQEERPSKRTRPPWPSHPAASGLSQLEVDGLVAQYFARGGKITKLPTRDTRSTLRTASNSKTDPKEEEIEDPDPLPDEHAERRRQVKALRDEVLILNEREQRIFKARRMSDEPITLDSLSVELRVSIERVRQIEMRAFEKVARAMRSKFAHDLYIAETQDGKRKRRGRRR